jgi:large subunit ribosomal protein L7e
VHSTVPSAESVLVPETLLKVCHKACNGAFFSHLRSCILQKRKTNEKTREQNIAKALEARKVSSYIFPSEKTHSELLQFFFLKVRKARRQLIFKRAESYVNYYRAQEREEIRLRRIAKHNGDYYVPSEPKVYFVIRLRG